MSSPVRCIARLGQGDGRWRSEGEETVNYSQSRTERCCGSTVELVNSELGAWKMPETNPRRPKG